MGCLSVSLKSDPNLGNISTLDSPDQGAFGIAVDTTLFENTTLKIVVVKLGIEYNGEFADGSFKGIFMQAISLKSKLSHYRIMI